MIGKEITKFIQVNGDEYEDVELIADIPEEINSIVPVQFIGVKRKHHTVYLEKEFVASLQLEKNLIVIFS